MHLSGKFAASLFHSHLTYGSFSLHLLSYQRLITAIQLWSVHLEQLQRVINAAAKIINNKRKHDHINPLLHDLHWLCICQRIDFKISSRVFSLSWVMHRHTCLSLALHKFLLGAKWELIVANYKKKLWACGQWSLYPTSDLGWHPQITKSCITPQANKITANKLLTQLPVADNKDPLLVFASRPIKVHLIGMCYSVIDFKTYLFYL